MHTGRRYKLTEFLFWTRREIYTVLLLAIVPTSLYTVLGWKWLAIPWLPIALIGTAASFIVSFKNNATYSRLWEARQIWGAIINGSRSWAVTARDFVSNQYAATPVSTQELATIHQQLVYRHLAWITALRYQLREPRNWENMRKNYNQEYQTYYKIAEWDGKLTDDIAPFLSTQEAEYVLGKKNRATHVLSLQSTHLKKLTEAGLIDNYRYIELEKMLADLYDQQGKCERIKNFPYPRQFATINMMFVRLFVTMIPFGLLQEFDKLGTGLVWLTVPFSALVSWVFLSMEKIGESTENPFEGGPNDVPITALSRTIEVDLRELLDETNVPPALQPAHDILM